MIGDYANLKNHRKNFNFLLLVVLLLGFILILFCNTVSATVSGEISSITITPSTTIYVQDTVYHYVTVRNTGTDGFSYIIRVLRAGSIEDNTYDNIYVAAGQSRKDVWTTTAPAYPGTATYTYQLYWDRTWPTSNVLLYTTTKSVSIKQTPTPVISSTGSLYVSSSPSGASVYVDGSYQGTTPTSLSSQTTGTHTIELTRSGYKALR